MRLGRPVLPREVQVVFWDGFVRVWVWRRLRGRRGRGVRRRGGGWLLRAG